MLFRSTPTSCPTACASASTAASFRRKTRFRPNPLRAAIEASAARWPGIRCTIRRILLATPFVPIAGQERLVEAIARNAKAVLGEDIAPHGVPIYTDARHYSGAGVPTVLYGAGPRTLVERIGFV